MLVHVTLTKFKIKRINIEFFVKKIKKASKQASKQINNFLYSFTVLYGTHLLFLAAGRLVRWLGGEPGQGFELPMLGTSPGTQFTVVKITAKLIQSI